MIGIVIIVQIKSCLTANQNVQHVSQILDCEPAYDLQHFKLNGHYQLNASIFKKCFIFILLCETWKLLFMEAESVFRMMRASASKFGGDKRDEIIDKVAIHPVRLSV